MRAIETSEFELRLQELEGRFKAQDAALVAGAGSAWPYNRYENLLLICCRLQSRQPLIQVLIVVWLGANYVAPLAGRRRKARAAWLPGEGQTRVVCKRRSGPSPGLLPASGVRACFVYRDCGSVQRSGMGP